MNGILREQRLCNELSEARRHIKYLEERLEAAEAQIREQDGQVDTLVNVLGQLSISVVLLNTTDVVELDKTLSGNLFPAIHVLNEYATEPFDGLDF